MENWQRRPTAVQVANINAANRARISVVEVYNKLLAAHGGDEDKLRDKLLAAHGGDQAIAEALSKEIGTLLSTLDLLRKLFADIDIAAAGPDLRDYRATPTEQLIDGLVDEDPVVAASYKLVLIERMLIAGVYDIIDFIIKCAPHSCAVINLTARRQWQDP